MESNTNFRFGPVSLECFSCPCTHLIPYLEQGNALEKLRSPNWSEGARDHLTQLMGLCCCPWGSEHPSCGLTKVSVRA
jgi:hypothetical protein